MPENRNKHNIYENGKKINLPFLLEQKSILILNAENVGSK